MSTPAIVIRLGLEAAPVLYADIPTDADERRLADWLAAHPAYLTLLHRAVELAEEARAA